MLTSHFIYVLLYSIVRLVATKSVIGRLIIGGWGLAYKLTVAAHNSWAQDSLYWPHCLYYAVIAVHRLLIALS